VAAEAVTATPQQQVGEVTDVFEPFVPLAIGAATTTTTIAVVSVARTLQGKEEQRKRLLKVGRHFAYVVAGSDCRPEQTTRLVSCSCACSSAPVMCV
jgi:hypothetical protein